MDRLDHRVPPFVKRRGRRRSERGMPEDEGPRRNSFPLDVQGGTKGVLERLSLPV